MEQATYDKKDGYTGIRIVLNNGREIDGYVHTGTFYERWEAHGHGIEMDIRVYQSPQKTPWVVSLSAVAAYRIAPNETGVPEE